MALRAEVVDFVRLGLLDDADQIAGVAEITVVQLELGVGDVGILINIVDALGVERGGAPLDAVDDIAFFQQEFGKVGAILAGDAGDEGDLPPRLFLSHYFSRYFNKLGLWRSGRYSFQATKVA